MYHECNFEGFHMPNEHSATACHLMTETNRAKLKTKTNTKFHINENITY